MTAELHNLMVASIVSLAATASAPQTPASQTPITIHTDEIVLPSQAQTLAQRLKQVDASVRVRIERSQAVAAQKTVPAGVDPIFRNEPEMQYAITVLEVLKDNGRLPVTGFTTTVVQPAGSIVVDGRRIDKDIDRFRLFSPGEEYVLLLEWDAARGAFAVKKPSDAFLVSGSKVVVTGRAPYADAQAGILVPEFLARMRAAASARMP
jgi:hypothetical protein